MPLNESKKKIDISARRISAGWPKVGYDGDEKKDIAGFYARNKGATKSRTSLFAKKKLADIFIHAMALGRYKEIPQEYDKASDRKDSIDMEYIANTPEYMWMMISIALVEAEKNGEDPLAIFDEPRTKILDVCERYANYGVKLLMDIDAEASISDPFSGYEKKFEKILEDMNR